jgi:hypothetical protein
MPQPSEMFSEGLIKRRMLWLIEMQVIHWQINKGIAVSFNPIQPTSIPGSKPPPSSSNWPLPKPNLWPRRK